MPALAVGRYDEHKQLMARILAGPQFAHAELLQRILRFLYEHARRNDSAPLKEYEIAINAINRPESFDPKLDAIVRVSIGSIRERLHAYFETEGQYERWRLEIPKGQYRLSFVPTRPADSEHKADVPCPSLRRFWGPYLSSNYNNLLLYTELLCFRDSHGNYYRNIHVNDAAAGKEQALRDFPHAATDEILPSFHFTSAGEMSGALSLIQAFHKMRSGLQVKNARLASWAGVQGSNLVVLGSARTNGFVRQLQGGEKLILRDNHIEDCEAQATSATYRSSRFLCGSLERVSEYALVTRRPGPVTGTCVTIIAGNHGRAMEGAVEFLVREDKVRELLDVLVPSCDSAMPTHFQLLLRIEMVDFDEEVIDIQYVTHKI